MDVEFAFLADAAQAEKNKLYVLGAGFDRITAKQFPAVHPVMSFALKLRLHPAECERQHNLEVELWDPDGQPIGIKVAAQFRADRPKQAGRPAFVQLVMNLAQLRFPKPGDYSFQILVDEQHLKSVPLYLELVESNSKEEGSDSDR
jgi:hypothetical protein